jgi:hypothetical protein
MTLGGRYPGAQTKRWGRSGAAGGDEFPNGGMKVGRSLYCGLRKNRRALILTPSLFLAPVEPLETGGAFSLTTVGHRQEPFDFKRDRDERHQNDASAPRFMTLLATEDFFLVFPVFVLGAGLTLPPPGGLTPARHRSPPARCRPIRPGRSGFPA